MKTNRHRDPRNTKSSLGQAYWQHYARVMVETQQKTMGHISTAVLEGIESFATDNPESQVVWMWNEMLRAIGPNTPAGNRESIVRFSTLYKDASDIVFPSTSAYI